MFCFSCLKVKNDLQITRLLLTYKAPSNTDMDLYLLMIPRSEGLAVFECKRLLTGNRRSINCSFSFLIWADIDRFIGTLAINKAVIKPVKDDVFQL